MDYIYASMVFRPDPGPLELRVDVEKCDGPIFEIFSKVVHAKDHDRFDMV